MQTCKAMQVELRFVMLFVQPGARHPFRRRRSQNMKHQDTQSIEDGVRPASLEKRGQPPIGIRDGPRVTCRRLQPTTASFGYLAGHRKSSKTQYRIW